MILHPEKVATPAEAFLERLGVQANVPVGVGWVLMDNVTEAVELVTVLPQASSTVTTGWGPKLAPLAPPPGWVVNPSCEAEPALTVKLVEVPVTAGKLASVAVNELAPAA